MFTASRISSKTSLHPMAEARNVSLTSAGRSSNLGTFLVVRSDLGLSVAVNGELVLLTLLERGKGFGEALVERSARIICK